MIGARLGLTLNAGDVGVDLPSQKTLNPDSVLSLGKINLYKTKKTSKIVN
jgi:hypothetical protein